MVVAWVALTALVTYFLSELVGYGIHWASHRHWSGPLWRAHMTHHKLYVPSYEGVEYREAGGDSFVLWMTPPFVLLAAATFWLLPWWIALTAVATMGLDAVANNAMHTAFHVPTHWFRKAPWFNRANRWHYQHHMNVRSNLGINVYLYDRVFGTFRTKRWIRR